VAGELAGLSDGIKSLIGTEHPVLNAAAKYFFELDGGKKIRPTMVSGECDSATHAGGAMISSASHVTRCDTLRHDDTGTFVDALDTFDTVIATGTAYGSVV